MGTNVLKTIARSASLLRASASVSAFALDVSVGGVSASALSGGGQPAATANTGSALGGVTATAKALDSSDGTVADVNVGLPGNNKARVKIGTGAGSLANVDSNGNPLDGGNATSGVINLGGLLGGVGGLPGDDGPGAPGAGGPTGGPGAIYASLNSSQQAKLRANCRNILANPGGYSRDLVSICRLLKL